MSQKYIQVSALDSFREYTLHVDEEWYDRVKNDFNRACEENPEYTATLFEFFISADRSDLIDPKTWFHSTYGEKSDSRQFEGIVSKFERSDKLIAKHYVENRPSEEVEKALEPIVQ